jgi:hypothetical protein
VCCQRRGSPLDFCVSSDLDEFIDNLDELLLPDLVLQIEKISVFDATSTRDA